MVLAPITFAHDLRAIRLSPDIAQPPGSAARYGRHLQLHRHRDRRLAPRYGVCRAVRAADLGALCAAPAPDRLRSHRGGVEVVRPVSAAAAGGRAEIVSIMSR